MPKTGRGPPSSDGPALAPAKVRRPELGFAYPRERLFQSLDALSTYPIVWVSAPAGSGKTTLAHSYLQARELTALWYHMDRGDSDPASFFYYMASASRAVLNEPFQLPLLTSEYQDIQQFARNYFRILLEHLPRPAALVLDDYHEVDETAALHSALAHVFAEVSPGVNVIVLSRREPPASYAALYSSGRLGFLDPQELKFTPEETGALLQLRARRCADENQCLSTEQIQALYAQTQGWVAGLMLLTDDIGAGPLVNPADINVHYQSIFDYFGYEVLRNSATEVQDFLLQTAFLSKLTVVAAAELTGRSDCEDILRELVRRNYFTVRLEPDAYAYHPLFRVFLMHRVVATYSQDRVRALKQRTAHVLAQTAELEPAVDLLIEIEAWSDAAQLIVAHARELTEQGRTRTLCHWLEQFPPELMRQQPWLLYWRAQCTLALNPAAARADLEQAFALFSAADDASPLYLCWCALIDSFVIEADDYTPMHTLLNRYPNLAAGRIAPQAEIENASIFKYVTALRLGWSDHPDLPHYAQRAEEIFAREKDPRKRVKQALALAPYLMWRGDIEPMWELLHELTLLSRQGKLTPLDEVTLAMFKVINAAGAHDSAQSCAEIVEHALSLADQHAIHILDVHIFGYGIWAHLCAGEIESARSCLREMARHRSTNSGTEAFYCTMSALLRLHDKDPVRALADAAIGYDIAISNSLSSILTTAALTLASSLAANNQMESALRLVHEELGRSERTRSRLFKCYALQVEAQVRRLQGDQQGCLQLLRQMLHLARAMHTGMPVWYSREDSAQLFVMALASNVESDYVHKLIAARQLSAPHSVVTDRWPWHVRIYTLGRFAVWVGETALRLRAQGKSRPLQLVRALAGLGGRNVSAEVLAQALWPNSDGDMAKTALETTLHRLRRLLGDRCIVMHDDQLSFNADYCWLDTWAFERVITEFDTEKRDPDCAHALLDLYRGAFLEGDHSWWAHVARERLRSKFVRAVLLHGAFLEASGQWLEAIPWYERGIEADPLIEELYIRLMRCHHQLGNVAEVAEVYTRCRETLAATLNVEPAAETHELHESVKRDGAAKTDFSHLPTSRDS